MTAAEKAKLITALKRHYKTDVMFGKGGFFVRGKGHITISKARQITGIKATPRPRRPKTGGYGDYATLRKVAGRL